MLVYATERPKGLGEILSRAAACGAKGTLFPSVKLAAPECAWLAWIRSLPFQRRHCEWPQGGTIRCSAALCCHRLEKCAGKCGPLSSS